jgi:hypothetical protein
MRPKRQKITTVEVRQNSDNVEYYDNSTTTQSDIILSSLNNNNSNRSTTNESSLVLSTNTTKSASASDNNKNTASSSNNNTTSSSDNTNSTLTSSLHNNITGRQSSSIVWQYAIKSHDGKTATCQLCDYTCTVGGHSTSTIRYHLIRKHNKYDLIVQPSPTAKSKPCICQHLKQELHSLCYNSVIIDNRPFNDFRKNGILAIFNKLCPGIIDFYKYKTSEIIFLQR